jgi:hypothetical protein
MRGRAVCSYEFLEGRQKAETLPPSSRQIQVILTVSFGWRQTMGSIPDEGLAMNVLGNRIVSPRHL